jgi:hypothetical protein
MRIWFAAALLTILAALPLPARAQWSSFPTPGVPKTADGKPNLQAPAPRTADGKPDLTGMWENSWFYKGKIGTPPVSPPGEPPAASFFNVGANIKGGLPMRPWAAELVNERKARGTRDNPDANCLPMGIMQFHEQPQPRKIVQTPGLILIIYEANSGLRQIFTDGRPLPVNDPQPWWYGYSAGRWEGDTLVVETVGLRDGGWLDIQGSPLTDAAKITERFRRPDYGTLQIDVTVDDPKAYTEPFSVRVNQRVVLDEELIEFVCNENEKSVQHMVGSITSDPTATRPAATPLR